MYDSLSFASQVSAYVKKSGTHIQLAFNLRRLDSKMRDFTEKLYGIMEGSVSVPTSEEPITPERIENAVSMLRNLHGLLDTVYESARKRRLTNSSLLAAPLNRMLEYSQILSDMADWLELYFQKEELESIFNRAHHEKEHGDIFDLSQVE